jgi:hypothetical protein
MQHSVVGPFESQQLAQKGLTAGGGDSAVKF